ncbi:uncharacterized protein KY384_002469 [Bacidia gigantensis]|uniref:uncharacterized protein n=1 Tax=Bacidia gigantensis TaxID=2732470 RepID=UPI001D041799|nr:uncharacterized protein KY384_002469 [Bacidia gigantensis]KAG8532592.1 hypothetical protein KY384_002469 [Bacidia gigantensis]
MKIFIYLATLLPLTLALTQIETFTDGACNGAGQIVTIPDGEASHFPSGFNAFKVTTLASLYTIQLFQPLSGSADLYPCHHLE